jgi:hypothetical protein
LLGVLEAPRDEARIVDGTDVTVGKLERETFVEANPAFAVGLLVERVQDLLQCSDAHQ